VLLLHCYYIIFIGFIGGQVLCGMWREAGVNLAPIVEVTTRTDRQIIGGFPDFIDGYRKLLACRFIN